MRLKVITIVLIVPLLMCNTNNKDSGTENMALLSLVSLSRQTTSCGNETIEFPNEKEGRQYKIADCSARQMESMNWESVNLGGPKGFFSNNDNEGFGRTGSFHGIENVLRDTMLEVTYRISTDNGFVQISANSEKNLRNHTHNFAHIRLSLEGIQGSFWNNYEAEVVKGNPARLSINRNQVQTVCLEFHREDHNGDLDMHLIAWSKPCGNLTELDKTIYDWDQKYHLIHEGDFDLTDPEELEDWNEELRRFARGNGIGFVTHNAKVLRIMPILE